MRRLSLAAVTLLASFGLVGASVSSCKPKAAKKAAPAPEPEAPTAPKNFTAVGAGNYHSCGIASGDVYCWGYGGDGQLGNGERTSSPVAVKVVGLSEHAVSITLGKTHSCALLESGTVACWGRNDFGQLGNGTATLSPSPVFVKNLPPASAVRAGGTHTCALTADQRVFCWGDNRQGQLSKLIRDDETISTLPYEVAGMHGVPKWIVAGDAFSCALLANRLVECWGGNDHGELGRKKDEKWSATTPVEVNGLEQVDYLSASVSHVCAIAQGRVKCWGNNADGQSLGMLGAKIADAPTSIDRVYDAAADVSAGDRGTCLVTKMKGVRCWGFNGSGQVGNNQAEAFSPPTEVVGIEGEANAVAVGGWHACALLRDGAIRCWGDNEYGQLGDGASGRGVHSKVPVAMK